MTGDRHPRALNPHLRTRPATMLTAIGLCLIIMLIQLVPDIQDLSSRFTSVSSASTTTVR